MSTQIYLASASPRRAQLLTQIGIVHMSLDANINEVLLSQESAVDYVSRLAVQKAQTVWQHNKQHAHPQAILPVLGADTIVVHDGVILGKPSNQAEFLRFFARLSGTTHDVYSAIAVVYEDKIEQALSYSQVRFSTVTPQQALQYWMTGEPCDKAGGYAIQGLGALFIDNLSGSYSGVMGLPLFETAQLLAGFGVHAAVMVEGHVA